MRTAAFPELFIVGAPRSGTTAICAWLGEHPDVCFSIPKEPHFFTRTLHAAPASDVSADYVERFFAHRTAANALLAEGSVSTLYDPAAAQTILEHAPEARFVAMLRNPLELVPSYHRRLLFLLEEDEPDLARAWALQGDRARGEHVPALCRGAAALAYREIGSLGHHLARLFEVAGRERSHVILFDDFARDPAAAYAGVLRFAGLEHDGRRDFPARQATKTFRYRWLQRLLYRPSERLGQMALAQERSHAARTGSRRAGRRPFVRRARKRLNLWNLRDDAPQRLPPATRDTLRRAFAEDVQRLSALLGRDLAHWLDEAASGAEAEIAPESAHGHRATPQTRRRT